LHAASAAMLFDGIDATGNAVSEHFDDLMNGRSKPGTWYGDLGWQGDLQRAGYASATFRSSGSLVGADFRVGTHALLGYAVGESRGYGQLDESWDHSRTWSDHAMLYGGVVQGSWYARAQVGGGWFREDMQRLLLLGGLSASVGSDFSGRYATGALEGGYQFRAGSTRITPFVDVRYQHLDQGAFAEAGGYGFGLMADARTTGRLQSGIVRCISTVMPSTPVSPASTIGCRCKASACHATNRCCAPASRCGRPARLVCAWVTRARRVNVNR